MSGSSSKTSPPYWDDDDEDSGVIRLYGEKTWEIKDFQTSMKKTREFRSDHFYVGGYKWEILVRLLVNKFSLFLCSPDHDKLNEGWSRLVLFTMAVVNQNPEKTKCFDSLHSFCREEDDWGWKTFMDQPKPSYGFYHEGSLIIKAQIQVIRKRSYQLFRCISCQYRRELAPVHLTEVKQIFFSFVEEKEKKLDMWMRDINRWESFRKVWDGFEEGDRRNNSKEKLDSIFEGIVKHFFKENEVTSTLVMDSLHSGLKALKGQTKSNKGKGISTEAEDLPFPLVRIEEDTFVLEDGVWERLREAWELKRSLKKDVKGPQNRKRDGGSAEDFTKDSVECNFTELGRMIIEIFVLDHIFSTKTDRAVCDAKEKQKKDKKKAKKKAAVQTSLADISVTPKPYFDDGSMVVEKPASSQPVPSMMSPYVPPVFSPMVRNPRRLLYPGPPISYFVVPPAESSVAPKPYSDYGSTRKATENPTQHQDALTLESPMSSNQGSVVVEKPASSQPAPVMSGPYVPPVFSPMVQIPRRLLYQAPKCVVLPAESSVAPKPYSDDGSARKATENPTESFSVMFGSYFLQGDAAGHK